MQAQAPDFEPEPHTIRSIVSEGDSPRCIVLQDLSLFATEISTCVGMQPCVGSLPQPQLTWPRLGLVCTQPMFSLTYVCHQGYVVCLAIGPTLLPHASQSFCRCFDLLMTQVSRSRKNAPLVLRLLVKLQGPVKDLQRLAPLLDQLEAWVSAERV